MSGYVKVQAEFAEQMAKARAAEIAFISSSRIDTSDCFFEFARMMQEIDAERIAMQNEVLRLQIENQALRHSRGRGIL